MPRLPHFLDNRFLDGGKNVNLMEDSWYLFLLDTETTTKPLCGWKNRPTEKCDGLTEIRTLMLAV
jgi:hypothetical protein